MLEEEKKQKIWVKVLRTTSKFLDQASFEEIREMDGTSFLRFVTGLI